MQKKILAISILIMALTLITTPANANWSATTKDGGLKVYADDYHPHDAFGKYNERFNADKNYSALFYNPDSFEASEYFKNHLSDGKSVSSIVRENDMFKFAQQVAVTKPENIDNYSYKAAQDFVDRNFYGAYQNSSKAVQLNPNNKKAYILRAFSNIKLNKPDEALSDCRNILRIDPTDGFAYLVKSKIYLDSSEYELAMADCDKAIELGVERADYLKSDIYLAQGKKYFKEGNYKKAEKLFKKSLEIKSENPHTWIAIGELKTKMGKKDEAKAAFENSKKYAELNVSNTLPENWL